MAIDVKRAVTIAKDHVRNVFGEDGGASPTLEEVWLDEEENIWNVTVGIRQDPARMAALGGAAKYHMRGATFYDRDYRVVRISASSGQPIAVKMRDAAA